MVHVVYTGFMMVHGVFDPRCTRFVPKAKPGGGGTPSELLTSVILEVSQWLLKHPTPWPESWPLSRNVALAGEPLSASLAIRLSPNRSVMKQGEAIHDLGGGSLSG